MKSLVVVESPTKAKTIRRFLGSDYEIKASMGHVMDLPKSKLGVDTEKNFKPDFQLVDAKKKVISDLKTASKNVKTVILATDPDREGEAIAAHVKDILLREDKDKKFNRIVFHEITKEAIDEALRNPRDVDENLVDAQIARRVLDRLVGYKLSPILWQKIRRGLSAGRVQSVALRLIAEREREIEKFKKEKYWTISAIFIKHGAEVASENFRVHNVGNFSEEIRVEDAKAHNENFESSPRTKSTEFELIEINGEKIEVQKIHELYDGQYRVTKTTIETLERAQGIVEDLSRKQFLVADVLKKETRRSPYAPFTTSTLQQDASRRLGFSGKRTMTLAQKLYEEGFITYHRTDSVVMAGSAVSSIRNYIEKEFGKKYIPDGPRTYKAKQKLAQEAHEAIRPTIIGNSPDEVGKELGSDYARLYELIWKRAAASQMADAIIESTVVLVDSNDKKYRLKTNGSVLIFDGFLKLTPQAINDTILPEFKASEHLLFKKAAEKEHETMPPPRYNDASLVATLEEKGIGRPSTYATIVSTIESRQYIERMEGRFLPTPVGVAVNDFLVENFSTVDDIPFTANMEDELDAIANEKKEWVPVIKSFYTDFEKTLDSVKSAERVKIEAEETDEKCPKCGSNLVIRIGKFGKFLACSSFPKCNFTKPYAEETGQICPRDGGKIILKKSKKGRYFYGCSNYPSCTFAAWKLEDIKKEQAAKQV
ncbi:MAG: type I DNA topoisomerase [Patescibacteria group bacterium]|nr:type I DNA topoisomerase [Patescibacteria group bacterium]